MKPSIYRRVVTTNVDGKSVVQSDEQMQAYEFESVPGYEHTLVWVNPSTPDLREEQRFDRYPESVVPGPGGTSLHFVTFPGCSGLRSEEHTSELQSLTNLVCRLLLEKKKNMQYVVIKVIIDWLIEIFTIKHKVKSNVTSLRPNVISTTPKLMRVRYHIRDIYRDNM